MGSFKLRLLGYFVFLTLVPLAAATAAFSQVAAGRETDRADFRLSEAVLAASGGFTHELDGAELEAASLAHSSDVQRALVRSDEPALARLVAEHPRAAFYARELLIAGSQSTAPQRSVDIVNRDRILGRVIVAVSLDEALADRLGRRAGLEAGELLVFAQRGRVIAGPDRIVGTAVAVPVDRADDVHLDGEAYRAFGAALLRGEDSPSLLVLTPRSAIEGAVSWAQTRLLAAAFVSLIVVAAVAFFAGSTIVATLGRVSRAARGIARGDLTQRVPVQGRDEFAKLGIAFNDMAAELESRLDALTAERVRVREALARVGTALAATHDAQALVKVIMESAMAATEAAGAKILDGGEELASAGDPGAGGEPVELGLSLDDESANGRLLLYPRSGRTFSEEALRLAGWFAGQASIALANAHLHRIVEQQAVTDQLTQLANRRRFVEALTTEVSRAERTETPLALVLADLDDFKAVNDRFGHQVGDDVLFAFAEVLRANLREIDVAARHGGEEFAILLPGADLAGAESLAERLRAAFAARRVALADGGFLVVTASFGVAAYPESCSSARLLAAADAALYRAKAEGKNRVAGDRDSAAGPLR